VRGGNDICEAASTLEVTESGASTHRQVHQPFAAGSVSLSIPTLQHDDVLEWCEAANSCCYTMRRWRVKATVARPWKGMEQEVPEPRSTLLERRPSTAIFLCHTTPFESIKSKAVATSFHKSRLLPIRVY